MRPRIYEVLTELSGALDDGVSLRFIGIDASTARVALDIDREKCQECLTPREVLESILLKRFRERGLEFSGVEVIEPPLPDGKQAIR
jgi:hypothetical protein